MKNTATFLSKTYDNGRLKNVTAAIDTALNARSLDVDTMEVELTTGPEKLGLFSGEPFALFDADGKRLFSSEDTALGAWSRGDALIFARGGSQYAIVYPESVTRVGPTEHRLSCTSALGKLAQLAHRGGIYSGAPAGPLLREICGYVNGEPAAGVTIYVAPEFENILLYGWLPYLSPAGENGADTGSARDNLMQVLFAINAYLRDDANGVLRVENLPTAAASVITGDRIYRENSKVVDEQPITEVTVLEHAYVVGSETRTLFDGTAAAGKVVVFSSPMANLSATGFSIIESGANYAVLSAGSGTLTGTPYVDTMTEVTRTIASADVPNPERIEKATLVSVTNSADVANRLSAYYAHRRRIECDAVIVNEDAGDVVSIYDPFDGVMRTACIERISPLQVSNVMKGRISALIGYEPWQTVAFDDVHDIITASGTYTFPADIEPGTQVTAILIGGGQGGYDGEDGEDGQSKAIGGQVYNTGTVISATAGNAGNGGVGGVGGAGGNVLRLQFLADPSDTVTVSVGAGGASGGGAGGNTTLAVGATTYSSADGSTGAYHDAYSGVTYGANGTNGTTGANGGKGGSATFTNPKIDGESGGDVGQYTGGIGGLSFKTDAYDNGGGGGGGASQGANGTNGSNADRDGHGNGGAGADGGSASAPVNYGDGGNGGHGGGGGGGCGSLKGTQTSQTYILYLSAAGGAGGEGGAGTAGKQGCVILIYRKPAEE